MTWVLAVRSLATRSESSGGAWATTVAASAMKDASIVNIVVRKELNVDGKEDEQTTTDDFLQPIRELICTSTRTAQAIVRQLGLYPSTPNCILHRISVYHETSRPIYCISEV